MSAGNQSQQKKSQNWLRDQNWTKRSSNSSVPVWRELKTGCNSQVGAAQLKFCTGLEIKLDAGGSHVGPKAQLISAGEVRTKKRKQTQKHL